MDSMNLRAFFLPPYARRRWALFFIIAGVTTLILSTASPTNYRGDWLDPRWWARVLGGLLVIGGIASVVLPARSQDP